MRFFCILVTSRRGRRGGGCIPFKALLTNLYVKKNTDIKLYSSQSVTGLAFYFQLSTQECCFLHNVLTIWNIYCFEITVLIQKASWKIIKLVFLALSFFFHSLIFCLIVNIIFFSSERTLSVCFLPYLSTTSLHWTVCPFFLLLQKQCYGQGSSKFFFRGPATMRERVK